MALTPAELDAMAGHLWASVHAGDRFPPFLAGISYDDALALQVRFLRRHLEAGAVLSGWKVGLTSARVRASFGGIDVRPFGYLDAAHTLPSGTEVAVGAIPAAAIETEFCFTVGERLSGRDLSPAAVQAGLATVAAGYEINQRPAGTLKPDLAMGATARMYNWGIVVGSGRPAADCSAAELADVRVTMTCLDGTPAHDATAGHDTNAAGTPADDPGAGRRLDERAGDHVDDHYLSIGLLARALADHGLALEPGQKIITGAVGRFPAQPGQRWRSDFAGVGTVEVQFT